MRHLVRTPRSVSDRPPKPPAESAMSRRRPPDTAPTASIGDGDIAVHLDADRIQIAKEIRRLPDGREPLRLVLDAKRFAARGPAVAVREAEVARARAIEKGDVAAHDGRFDVPLERD